MMAGSGVTGEKEGDEVLVWFWVAAGEDSISGTGQKASKFWGRVFEIYVDLIPDGKDHTSTACTARWGMINQDITKFCGLFAQVASVPKSKWIDDKYIEEAMEIFKLEGKGKRLGKEFIGDGCWHILKESLKWMGGCGYVWDRKN